MIYCICMVCPVYQTTLRRTRRIVKRAYMRGTKDLTKKERTSL